jgi:hypothetical protein
VAFTGRGGVTERCAAAAQALVALLSPGPDPLACITSQVKAIEDPDVVGVTVYLSDFKR